MPFVEQRQAARAAITAPVTVWMPAAQRSYRGGGVNFSKRGALIRLPLSSPIRIGQKIKLQIPSGAGADQPDKPAHHEYFCCVIRVDRASALHQAEILVALAFED
jgi:hypothetical protein